MKSHHETIVCNECSSIELAEVKHTLPWWTYIHECSKCKTTIMESEWVTTGTMHNGDMMQFLFHMKTGAVPIIITDPPYGVRKSDKDTDFEWDAEEEFTKNIHPWLLECLRVAKYTVVWYCAGKMLPLIFSDKVIREKFWRIHFWEKPPGSQYNGASHNNIWYNTEPILVFSNDFEKTISNYDKDVSFAYENMSYPTVAKKVFGHPTTKPLGEIAELVMHYSLPNDVILDPFAGSFTLAEACIRTGRQYICVEQDEGYYKKGLVRIANLNSQLDAFSSTRIPTKKTKKDENQESLM